MQDIKHLFITTLAVSLFGFIPPSGATPAEGAADITGDTTEAYTAPQVHMSLVIQGSAGANCSRCYQIQNPDAKNFCIARCKSSVSYCYQIRTPDKKNHCIALLKGNRSYCYQIRSPDLKNQCLAEVP